MSLCFAGDKMYVSGIDIIDGTPVLDVKPYIREYDTPHLHPAFEPEDITMTTDTASDTTLDTDASGIKDQDHLTDCCVGCDEICESRWNDNTCEANIAGEVECEEKNLACRNKKLPPVCCKLTVRETMKDESSPILVTDLEAGSDPSHVESYDCQSEHLNSCEESSAAVDVCGKVVSLGDQLNHCPEVSSSWIPSVDRKLQVRFTQRALRQLGTFSKLAEQSHHRLVLLNNTGEAKRAIISMLTEDPRSIYRRHKCVDSLYFFTVDRLHVTCWFDQSVAEIVRIQSVDEMSELLPKDYKA